MKIFFIRVDASVHIGTGHVMRCLCLAKALQSRLDCDVQFVCRALPGNLIDYIFKQGFFVHRLPMNMLNYEEKNYLSMYEFWLGVSWEQDAVETARCIEQEIDWLIIDHYALDQRWEYRLTEKANKIMVIDDLANRGHHCHLLLDQNFYFNQNKRYQDKVPMWSESLLGPKYALLRPMFLQLREKRKKKMFNRAVAHILLFMGGSDLKNSTAKILRAFPKKTVWNGFVDVVVGQLNINQEEISTLCAKDSRFRLHFYSEQYASLLARADLAIGAGGISTWERCCIGLPTLVVSLAENQEEPSHDLGIFPAIEYLGPIEGLDSSTLEKAIQSFIFSDVKRGLLMKKSKKLVDGKGLDRVLSYLNR